MWIRTTSLKKPIFYAVSVFLHLALLLFLSAFTGSVRKNRVSNQPFRVKVVAFAEKEPGGSSKAASVKKIAKRIPKKLKKTAEKTRKIRPKKTKKGLEKQKESGLATRQDGRPGGFFSFSPPRVLFQMKPEYPFVARLRGYEGKVILRALVGKNGRVLKIKIVKSSGYKILDQAAVKALYSWRFEPARLNGLPMDYWVEIPIVFKRKIR